MKKLYIAIAFIVSLSLWGCSFTYFGDLNENPNNPTRVEPDFLFATAIKE